MLQEIRNTRQIPDEPHRRWFTDDLFDLIVWAEAGSAVTGFQLCYRNNGREWALTWLPAAGYLHNRIDSGEGRARRPKMTPILVQDGTFDRDLVLGRFIIRAGLLEYNVVSFVVDKLRAYSHEEEACIV